MTGAFPLRVNPGAQISLRKQLAKVIANPLSPAIGTFIYDDFIYSNRFYSIYIYWVVCFPYIFLPLFCNVGNDGIIIIISMLY